MVAGLPRAQIHERFALVHARPDTAWRAPMDNAADGDLQSTYGGLGRSTVVYGHIHRPYIRSVGGVMVANSGSVGLPHDGDRRAWYLLLDDARPSIRRVEYDVDRELKALRESSACRTPIGWRTFWRAASPQVP